MSPLLGGPGVACSVSKLRRLEAGELAGDERDRLEAHVAGCARCRETRAELAEEASALHALLPFQDFAAGVAEKLARDEHASRTRRRWARGIVPLALAASLVAVFLTRPPPPPMDSLRRDRPKGGSSFVVHVQDGAGARELAPGEPVPVGARMRVSLHPAGHAWAAVLFQDPDGVSILYSGPAVDGALPGAFEWSGAGRALLVVVLDDSEIETSTLQAQVRARGPEGAQLRGARAEVLVRELRKGKP